MPAASSSRSTMSDVARKAGVSEKSVSRVVNREPYVSASLRAKVEAAIAELNYVPDPAARSLASARSFTVSLLIDTAGVHYAIKLLEGAYEACMAYDYHLRVENLDHRLSDADLLERLGQILHSNRLDGIVLSPIFCDNMALLDFLEMRGIAYSRIAPFIDRDRAPSVSIDDAAAGAEIADLLVRNGHRRFGLVNGLMQHGAALERRTGFLDRLAEIAPEATVTEAEGHFVFEGGISAGKELLSGPERPTAIFAANDTSAAGVMVACAQLGIRVPDDLSICGFDNSLLAKSVWPYLTTINQPVAEMAFTATRLLIDRNAYPAGSQHIKLTHHLVERESVRKLD